MVFQVREVFEEFQNDYNKQMQDTADKFQKMDETVKDFQNVSDGSIQGILEESQRLKVSQGQLKFIFPHTNHLGCVIHCYKMLPILDRNHATSSVNLLKMNHM